MSVSFSQKERKNTLMARKGIKTQKAEKSLSDVHSAAFVKPELLNKCKITTKLIE